MELIVVAVCLLAAALAYSFRAAGTKPVSYTHLTLPTILLV